ncbi:MAG: glycosyltransferase [Candidatus Peregrinibacteria bacterium GW2011_GWF2_43_17]|nr:MAG: glycosyltransferase [Candidatus Peregrinibacteria bacterium GW2011_GWF2_43_17]HAU39842.1 glycosyltransferase family 4 protein [Candidatus Peregrinibacteria bacterium]
MILFLKIEKLQVALVHDFLIRLGGAERVLFELSKMYPKAPIYTLLYDEKVCGSVFPKDKVKMSCLKKLPGFMRKRHKYLFPFMPMVVEQFDLSKFDMVISSSNAYAHGIVTNLRTKHLCYCHSPMRYAWDWTHNYLNEQRISEFTKRFVLKRLEKIRMWDKLASDRVDKYLANSQTVKDRISKYYRRDADVVFPPVDVDRFTARNTNENYFLIVSTLTPYKRIDLAISLFNRTGMRLVIIGDGNARSELEKMSGPNIDFLGFKDDDIVKEYMENSRGVIFAGEDDFGIVPVEAMACGKPVLAYGRGGATETVVPGITGEFFYEPTLTGIEDGMARLLLNEKNYNYMDIRKHAEKFGKEIFINGIKKAVRETWTL